MNLIKEYNKKLTNYSAKRKVRLTFSSNLWDFYKKNRADLEYIMISATCPFWGILDKEEFFSEILILLHDRKVLEQFDSSKASLRTFISQRIYGYTRHILEKYMRQHSPFYKRQDKWRWQRMLVHGINGPNNDTESWLQLAEDVIAPDQEVSLQNWVEKVRESLSDKLRKTFDLILMGYSNQEISQIQKVSPSAAMLRKNRIAELSKNLKEALTYA